MKKTIKDLAKQYQDDLSEYHELAVDDVTFWTHVAAVAALNHRPRRARALNEYHHNADWALR